MADHNRNHQKPKYPAKDNKKPPATATKDTDDFFLTGKQTDSASTQVQDNKQQETKVLPPEAAKTPAVQPSAKEEQRSSSTPQFNEEPQGTLDQKRAAYAWSVVQELLVNRPEEWKNEYAVNVTGLPASILANGLGQTSAMLLKTAGKNKQSVHYALYTHMQHLLCRDNPFAPYRRQSGLMEAIVNGDRQQYMKAQFEVLSWLSWLKKFAVAFLKKEKAAVEEQHHV